MITRKGAQGERCSREDLKRESDRIGVFMTAIMSNQKRRR